MDWLDRLSIWAIVILIISSFALISGHVGAARPDRAVQQKAVAADHAVVNNELDSRIKMIKTLMEADSVSQAEAMTKELLQKYPDQGQPHMAMGDLLMRKQDPISAIFEYKEAVTLNPDFLDKKTPLFQGKKLKSAVAEALAEIDKKIKLNPSDEAMKSNRKTIYFLQRKIAGSCS
jgi:tetratricopeptide (TPR) repeat protein